MNQLKVNNWLQEHDLKLEESFCSRLKCLVREYKKVRGYKTVDEVYALLGISKQNMSYWAANPCRTQIKKTVFDNSEGGRGFWSGLSGKGASC